MFKEHRVCPMLFLTLFKVVAAYLVSNFVAMATRVSHRKNCVTVAHRSRIDRSTDRSVSRLRVTSADICSLYGPLAIGVRVILCSLTNGHMTVAAHVTA